MVNVLTPPRIIKQPFASDGDKNNIPENPTGNQQASLKEGFPEVTSLPISQGGIPPIRRDFNGVLNLVTQFYFFTQNGGSYTFSEEVSEAIGGYPKNAILWYFGSDGRKTLVVSNRGNNSFNFVQNPNYIGDNNSPWSEVSTKISNLPLGSIVSFDHPVSDFGFEPLNDSSTKGKIISNASKTYPDFWNKLVEYKQLASTDVRYNRYTATNSQYNTELNTKGFCGLYVVDVEKDQIRLPYFGSAYLQSYESGDVDKVAGLPNITGQTQPQDGYISNKQDATGCFSNQIRARGDSRSGDGGTSGAYFKMDASLSNPIYGKSNTVQTNSVGIYYYIVVSSIATSVTSTALEAKQDKSNLVTSLSASSTNEQYPSAKCVYDLIGDLESLLSQV